MSIENSVVDADIASEQLVERCYVYLGEQHATLWGEFFSIYEASGRMRAARWLANEIAGVLEEHRKDR